MNIAIITAYKWILAIFAVAMSGVLLIRLQKARLYKFIIYVQKINWDYKLKQLVDFIFYFWCLS